MFPPLGDQGLNPLCDCIDLSQIGLENPSTLDWIGCHHRLPTLVFSGLCCDSGCVIRLLLVILDPVLSVTHVSMCRLQQFVLVFRVVEGKVSLYRVQYPDGPWMGVHSITD